MKEIHPAPECQLPLQRAATNVILNNGDFLFQTPSFLKKTLNRHAELNFITDITTCSDTSTTTV
jgi:hypothetical protein